MTYRDPFHFKYSNLLAVGTIHIESSAEGKKMSSSYQSLKTCYKLYFRLVSVHQFYNHQYDNLPQGSQGALIAFVLLQTSLRKRKRNNNNLILKFFTLAGITDNVEILSLQLVNKAYPEHQKPHSQ